MSDVVTRLAETIAWCAPRAVAARAGETTRTKALMPPLFAQDENTQLDLLLGSPQCSLEAVDFIAARRREALELSNAPTPPLRELAGGRVFATDFDTDLCGAAIVQSNGFLDDLDIPGWDTWFAHEVRGRYGIVYGWVPPALLTLADRGFNVIPVNTVWWVKAEDLLRLLR
ncbi:hypothetical protein FGE12_24845 [Aggregicoccus sp. 17bor-14]|uniref:hypothetical protein n=1 Tax=Myxococcaceae TaxID=31 RepID=UPI00129C2909|nr:MULTISPECIES: hypothetical protein [Myxococcaceae]MBF5045658.1 hypothetical protein [Simulacricoccus sp. 17bor-14]MRI91395.1 hypothetical protein [Aggregicoccus sp. 17bor-14]